MKLVKAYIRECLLSELHVSPRVVSAVKGGDFAMRSPEGIEARSIADEWCKELELELGLKLPLPVKSSIAKFVAKRWKGLLARFRGDQGAALQTLTNLLDTKYASLRTGD